VFFLLFSDFCWPPVLKSSFRFSSLLHINSYQLTHPLPRWEITSFPCFSNSSLMPSFLIPLPRRSNWDTPGRRPHAHTHHILELLIYCTCTAPQQYICSHSSHHRTTLSHTCIRPPSSGSSLMSSRYALHNPLIPCTSKHKNPHCRRHSSSFWAPVRFNPSSSPFCCCCCSFFASLVLLLCMYVCMYTCMYQYPGKTNSEFYTSR
jgi:hypothetical protein